MLVQFNEKSKKNLFITFVEIIWSITVQFSSNQLFILTPTSKISFFLKFTRASGAVLLARTKIDY